MTKSRDRISREDAEAGCREAFVDAELYDHEYRHRRADINFYRRLANNRMEFAKGTILDLACGSGIWTSGTLNGTPMLLPNGTVDINVTAADPLTSNIRVLISGTI